MEIGPRVQWWVQAALAMVPVVDLMVLAVEALAAAHRAAVGVGAIQAPVPNLGEAIDYQG